MLYLVAILLPPLALLLVGKPFQAILNIFLCLLFWFPGAIHAVLVVHSVKADRRNEKLIRALRESGR